MKEFIASLSMRTRVLAAGAALLILVGLAGTVGVAQAELSIFSQPYAAKVQQSSIGVALTEQAGNMKDPHVVATGNAVEGTAGAEGKLLATDAPDGTNVLQELLGEDESMVPGKWYSERISAVNNGSIPQYVRLTVRKYWTDEYGKKLPNLDPALIELKYDDNDSTWVFSPQESTDERLVFYCTGPLLAGENVAAVEPPAISAIRILPSAVTNASLKAQMEKSDGKGLRVGLSAQVDAVQYHWAAAAAKSAWGIDVTNINGRNLGWNNDGSDPKGDGGDAQ